MNIHQTLEIYTYKNRLREVDSKKKILLATTALFITVTTHSPLLSTAVFLCMTTITLCKAKIPWRPYVKVLSAIFGFTFPAIAIMMWLERDLALSGDNMTLAILTLSKVLGGSSGLFFLTFTTPSAEIFGELRRMGVPHLFIELATMIYRYIFILLDEAGSMYSAQRLRLGYMGTRRSIRSLGMLSATLFVRSMTRGQRVFHAMETRGYKGIYPMQGIQKASRNTVKDGAYDESH